MPPKRQFRVRNFAQNRNRSMLLEDYSASRYPNLQLADIVSHVVEFAKDRDGSKFIQRKLDDATDHRKESIFSEMKPALIELMADAYGNFVVQKFFDVGNPSQQQELYIMVRENFLYLSLHKYGCRVVQKAVERGTMTQQFTTLQPCIGDVMIRVARDPNGNHVLQKSFQCVQPHIQDYLFWQLEPRLADLCLDLYGCRVIQCILQHGTVVHRTTIFAGLRSRAMSLIQDRYGNYVIQHALLFCSPSDQGHLIQFILDRVIFLAVQKYASNVVEKCLNLATPQQQIETMDQICYRDGLWLKRFCTETYANYVVQKLIDTATLQQLESLHGNIAPYFSEMERHVCGRKVIGKLEERLEALRLNELPVQFQFQDMGLLDI